MSRVEIEIDYTNHRGERAIRRIRDPSFTKAGSPYHPGVRHLVIAIDVAKDDLRTFNPAHIHSWHEVIAPPMKML